MAAVTGFRVCIEPGGEIPGDAHGNNVAFACPNCGYPVLAVARAHQRGSSPSNPAICRGCDSEWILRASYASREVFIEGA